MENISSYSHIVSIIMMLLVVPVTLFYYIAKNLENNVKLFARGGNGRISVFLIFLGVILIPLFILIAFVLYSAFNGLTV